MRWNEKGRREEKWSEWYRKEKMRNNDWRINKMGWENKEKMKRGKGEGEG